MVSHEMAWRSSFFLTLRLLVVGKPLTGCLCYVVLHHITSHHVTTLPTSPISASPHYENFPKTLLTLNFELYFLYQVRKMASTHHHHTGIAQEITFFKMKILMRLVLLSGPVQSCGLVDLMSQSVKAIN